MGRTTFIVTIGPAGLFMQIYSIWSSQTIYAPGPNNISQAMSGQFKPQAN